MGNLITVTWNQMAPALNEDNYISYSDTATSVVYDNGVATQTWLKSGAGYTYTTKTREFLSWQEGHVYYVSYMLCPDFNCTFSIEWCGGQIPNGVAVPINQWSRLSFITTATSTSSRPIYLPDARTSGSSTNSTCQFKAPILIDFTLMYGAGNEPTTTEEFERQCYMNNISLTEFLPQNTAGTNQEWRIAYDKKSYTVRGDIASFRSAARVPIENLKCHFLPVQSGSGDASPDNIRPISGWNNVEIYKSKKNLYANGNQTITTGCSYVYKQLVNPLPPGTYTFSAIITSTDIDSNVSSVRFFGDDGSNPHTAGSDIAWLKIARSVNNSRISIIFNLDRTASWIYLYAAENYSKGVNDTADFKDIMIEAVNTTNEYEEYQGQTYTINWANDLYCGYVDLITGQLVETHKLLTITGDESNLSNNWDALLIPVPDSVSSNSENIVIACSHTNNCITGSNVWATSRSQNSNTNTNNICAAGSSGNQIRFRKRDLDPDFTKDIELYKTWLRQQNANGTPLQIVYKLTTPVTYSLTPQQLKTFLDQNNIWSNTNDITEVSYLIHDSSMIRNIRIAMMAHTHELPPAYQRCDYLQTVGTTSYIDTGVMGNDNTIKIDFIIEVLSKGNYSGIMGNHGGEDKKCWRFIQSASTINNGFNFTLNNRRAGASPRLSIDAVSSIVGLPIIVHMEYNLGTLTYQNVTYSTSTTTDTNEASNENIFIGRNGPTSTTSATAPNNRFHKYIKIYKSGFLIRNYVPCYRKSDNKAGFYDLINHTFNPSIGSAEFTAGYNT